MNIQHNRVYKSMRLVAFLLCALASFSYGFLSGTDYLRIHSSAIVVDAHNDVVQRILNGEDISFKTTHGHSDLPRFLKGGVDIEMFSIWVPPEKTTRTYYAQAEEQIDSVMSFVRRNPRNVGFARNSKEALDFIKKNKFVAMMGMEGGHPIGNDMNNLELFYNRGVRYLTLTWNNSTDWATSAKDETDTTLSLHHKGLTKLGAAMVRKMNELGMMIDVSHVGDQTFWDVMRTTTKPVIASHSSAWALRKHRRNLKDEQLKAIAQNGGVVFINFHPGFIDSNFYRKEAALKKQHQRQIDSLEEAYTGDDIVEGILIAEMLADGYKNIRPPLSVLIDHFDYVAKLIGVDHVGIGSDFDGISVAPLEMDDVTYLPNITRELLNRGYSESDVRKILGENFLRVLKEVERK